MTEQEFRDAQPVLIYAYLFDQVDKNDLPRILADHLQDSPENFDISIMRIAEMFIMNVEYDSGEEQFAAQCAVNDVESLPITIATVWEEMWQNSINKI